MDLAITIGQGLGFGVACGLSTIALLVPLFWPGIDARALGALGVPALVLAAVDIWLPQNVRILLRIAAGAAACGVVLTSKEPHNKQLTRADLPLRSDRARPRPTCAKCQR